MAFRHHLNTHVVRRVGNGPLVLKRHFNARYTKVEELRRGAEASIFLVKDSTVSHTDTGRPLAVRALRSDVTAQQGLERHELEVLQTMRDAPNIMPLHDHFMHGEHLCLVTDAYGPDLATIQFGFNRQPPFVRKRLPVNLVCHVARGVLLALSALHKNDIAHTDVKPDNIYFDAFGQESPDLLASEVVLGDFGEATPAHGDRTRSIQPFGLRSPEVVAGCKWDTKVDIWNLGCLVFELLAGNTLFPLHPEPLKLSNGTEFSADQTLFVRQHGTAMIEDENPLHLIAHFKHGAHFKELYAMGENGIPFLKLSYHPDFNQRQTLEDILHMYGIYDLMLHDFLAATLRMHPEERASADDLLRHPWLYPSGWWRGSSG
ncbi:unnamed protein product [Peniophora sp. CBMAI 1063]|nr:unnamed protein product [Peniophora sp. CBMAI 1063]